LSAGHAGAHGARHLIGDVQRFGLLSAAAVVDRYTKIVDRAVRADALASAPQLPDARADAWMVDSAARMAEACLRLLDGAAALIPARPQTTAAEVERLVLSPTGSGFSSETALWVHNPTSSPVSAVNLHMTSLISSNGVSIPALAATFSPHRLDMVETGTAREVRLRVDVPADQPPGLYHGLVLSSAAPSGPITVRLDVLERGRAGDDAHE
jgi:hypothetical protein